VQNRARSLAIGIALAPLAMFGLVAVYAHGSVQIICGSLAVGLFAIAVVVIYLIERPRPQRSARTPGTTELAVELDIDVRWDQEDPDTWFVQRDGGAALILKPHADDADRRLVVLVWAPCLGARVGPRDGRREYEWIAEVQKSRWIVDLDHDGSASELRHFVVLTNALTIEVAAANVVVQRVESIRLAASADADDAKN
jgi:hypothetical protein